MVIALLVSLTLSATGEVSLPGAAEQERFKSYFTQGETLYQQGEYGAAIWNFRQADSIRVTPEVAFDLAKCHEKLGDVAFATFYYRQYLKRAPNASDALDVAERVGTVLAKAEGEGRGLLEVQSPGATELSVNNGRFAEAPAVMFLPPGEYEVSARFPSGVKTMVTQIRTGKTSPVAFEPMPPPLLDSASAQVLLVGQAPSQPINKFRLIGGVAFGVGLATLVTGIVLGVMSSSDAGRCCGPGADRTLTPREAQDLATSANTKAGVANALVPVGGVLAAGGIVMFLWPILFPSKDGR